MALSMLIKGPKSKDIDAFRLALQHIDEQASSLVTVTPPLTLPATDRDIGREPTYLQVDILANDAVTLARISPLSESASVQPS